MRFEIDAALIAQLIDALKNPDFSKGLAIVVAIGVIGWVVTTYIKSAKA